MKRYNLRLVEMDSGNIVHEIEIQYEELDPDGVFIMNSIHGVFAAIEEAIEGNN